MEYKDTFGFLLRDEVAPHLLMAALSQAIGVKPQEVAELDLESSPPLNQPVLVETLKRTPDFITDVTVHIARPLVKERNSLDFATSVSRSLGIDALCSPTADMGAHADAAYKWILIRPDGARFVVEQQDTSGDNIVIGAPGQAI